MTFEEKTLESELIYEGAKAEEIKNMLYFKYKRKGDISYDRRKNYFSL